MNKQPILTDEHREQHKAFASFRVGGLAGVLRPGTTRRQLRRYIEKQGFSRQEADLMAEEMGFPKGAK